jgi:DNA replication protein DnaC
MTSSVAPELSAALRALKLGHLSHTLPDRLALGIAQSMPFEELLLLVLTDEIMRREGRASAERSKRARLDPEMSIERFDKTAKITYDKRLFAELCSLRFLQAHKNLVILGPVGVGKTFLANALGQLACKHKYPTRFVRADNMLRTLKQSRLDNSRDTEMLALATIELLIIDDFALEPMTREESRDIYQLFVERTGRASTIVTSNRDTSEWISTFDDILLAQSAIDRFKNAAYDLVIEGESYRPRLKPALDPQSPPPDAPVSKTKPRPRRR